MYSMVRWPSTRQTFLPMGGRRDTNASVPRWVCSRSATMAPMNVIQTNSQREISSDTVIDELKT